MVVVGCCAGYLQCCSWCDAEVGVLYEDDGLISSGSGEGICIKFLKKGLNEKKNGGKHKF